MCFEAIQTNPRSYIPQCDARFTIHVYMRPELVWNVRGKNE
jgi:hypothetical protein